MMGPDPYPPVLPRDPTETPIERAALAARQDTGGRVLSSLLDMALGSRNARTEAEALRLNFYADKR